MFLVLSFDCEMDDKLELSGIINAIVNYMTGKNYSISAQYLRDHDVAYRYNDVAC